VPNYVQSEGNAKFKVNFKPQEPAVHLLSVRFNGESVPGQFLSPLSSSSRSTRNMLRVWTFLTPGFQIFIIMIIWLWNFTAVSIGVV
jgi:hypothetical protein